MGRSGLAAWLVAAWLVGLFLATPFYRPYPRLTLPWLIAAWLGGAAAIGRFASPANRAVSAAPAAAKFRPLTLVLGIVLAVFAALGNPRILAKGVTGWQERTALQQHADAILRDCRLAITEDRAAENHRRSLRESTPFRGANSDREDVPFVVYVYAEPALFFHLSAAGVVARPVGDLEFARPDASQPGVPVFLVTGPHAGRERRLAGHMFRYRDRFRLVHTYRSSPSDLVLLDHYSPRQLAASADRPEQELRLYRLDENY
jgi:hypothetical protein